MKIYTITLRLYKQVLDTETKCDACTIYLLTILMVFFHVIKTSGYLIAVALYTS